ncbi:MULTISPECIES: hypothetical protein [Prevotella]|uniref:hypothetical protein n=1 Tax=Prevotella TaxID=838 RepID=UPI001E35BC48|nr:MULTISPECIES: hypothetical protein [Prevotella]
MKRLAILLYLISSLTILSAQNVCHVTVEYPNWGDTLLVFTQECVSGREIEDTIPRKNGNFSYDIELKSPAVMNITTPAFLERRDEKQIERFVIIPGESLKCKGYQKMEGTSFFQQYAKVRSFIKSPAYRDSEDKYQTILDFRLRKEKQEQRGLCGTDYGL